MVGIDLGITSAHTVRVLAGDGSVLRRHKAVLPTSPPAAAHHPGPRRRHCRKLDPQLARVYHRQMVQRGKDHLGAVCVVAAHLAERAWATLNRATPDVICDTDGTPVTRAGQAIIAEHWTVPEDVRRRRRSRKGKGPSASPHRT